MRYFLQRLLTKPVIQLVDRFSSRPEKKRVDKALSKLYQNITNDPGKKGPVINFDATKDKFIILSDQHKGARDGADIFTLAEQNYLAALEGKIETVKRSVLRFYPSKRKTNSSFGP